MERLYTVDNDKERERLKKLVNEITDKQLEMVIYKEGWTVAVALGHLAFWDLRRAALARYWKQNGVQKSDINGLDMNTVNDALVPLFLAMPPRKVAELAVSAAEAVDKEVASLPADLLPKIEAMGDRVALNRGFHRKMHLDEIETLLKSKRG
jgi:hypothetical protein